MQRGVKSEAKINIGNTVVVETVNISIGSSAKQVAKTGGVFCTWQV